MDSGITTVAASAVAVLGTLSSAVLTQLIGGHARKEERAEERTFAEQQRYFADRRAAYTRLNTEMRKFRRALDKYLEQIRAGHVPSSDEELTSLNDARDGFLEAYSDVQMTISRAVFGPARRINRGLQDVYDMARKLDGSETDSIPQEAWRGGGVSMPSALARLHQVLLDINSLRETMRHDLGVPND